MNKIIKDAQEEYIKEHIEMDKEALIRKMFLIESRLLMSEEANKKLARLVVRAKHNEMDWDEL